jgi:hypothetical protein
MSEGYKLGDFPLWLARRVIWDTIEIFTGYSKERFEKYKNDIKEAVHRRLFKAEVYLDELESGILGLSKTEERHLADNDIVWEAYRYALAVLNYKSWSEAKRDLTKLFACIRAILWEARKAIEFEWKNVEKQMKEMPSIFMK